MSEKISLPVSIVLAGVLIAGGIYLNGKITKSNPTAAQRQEMNSQNLAASIGAVGENDHILGSADARIIVLEYSDTECPFCKNFHATMNTIMQEYGKDGKVAWVYRHLPIPELHAKSIKEAEATECAASLGGPSKFWEYINKVYEMTPSNDGLDLAELPNIATQVGLSSADFNACLESGQFTNKINADIESAKAAGIQGTPYSILIDTKTDEYYPIPGALPYEQIKQAIDMVLAS